MTHAGQSPAMQIAARVHKLSAGHEFWPGYNPMDVPLAIFDGRQTYLFGYPHVPAGFTPQAASGVSALVADGRHPAIVANTCTHLDGVLVATLLLESIEPPSSDLAAIAIHEGFHVFQERNREQWPFANEAVMFQYPLTEVALFDLWRQEVEAWRRAVTGSNRALQAGWAAQALQTRRIRHGQMAPEFVQYERRMEVIEGLAAYIEAKAAGRAGVGLPAAGFAPTDVRRSCYGTGHAQAYLLDLFDPGWPAAVAGRGDWDLDDLLTSRLQAELAPVVACEFTEAERTHFTQRAHHDVAHVHSERTERLRTFRERHGSRIIIETTVVAPLQLAGFDPMNVHRIDGGILHARFLQLRSEQCELVVMREEGHDLAALTVGAGPHPLFNGVVRVEIVTSGETKMDTTSGGVSMQGGGVSITCGAAEVTHDGDIVRIRLL